MVSDTTHDTTIGRTDLLASFSTLIERAVAGSGQLACVSGAQGIGKTTLARHVANLATSSGLCVLLAPSDSASQSAPYAAWVTLLEAANVPDITRAVIARLRADSIAADSGWSRRDLMFGVVDALIEIAVRRPLCIMLDDLHLADPASLEVLTALAQRVSIAPILIVVAYRDDLDGNRARFAEQLVSLLRTPDIVRFSLRPLTRDDLAQLIERRYALPPRDTRRLEHYLDRMSQGNPLVISEVLLALEADGVLARRPDGATAWALDALPRQLVPPVLRELISHRLHQITDDDRIILGSAAVIGLSIDLDLWQSVCGLSAHDLEGVIERAWSAHVLRESVDRQGYTFTHPILREVLYDELILPRRRRLHRETAEHMALRRNPDVYVIAHHFNAARDPRAVEWLVRAGRQAEQTYALVTAAALYEDALNLLNTLGGQDTTTTELLFRLALVQRYTDPYRARNYLDEALALAHDVGAPGLAAGIRHYRALMRCWTGDIDGGLPELADAVEDISALNEPDYAELNRTVWFGARETEEHRGTLVDWHREVGRFRDALSGWDGRVADPTRPPPDGGQVRISPPGDRLNGISNALAQVGRPDDARRVYVVARRHFEALNHHHSVGWIFINELQFIGIPYDTEDRERLRWLADGATAAWERSSAAQAAALPRLAQLPLLYLRGAWQEARELGALSRTAPPGSPGYLDPVPYLAAIAFHTGDRSALWTLLGDVLPDGPDTPPGAALFADVMEVQQLVAQAALAGGDAATARDWIDAHARWIAWSGARRYEPGLALLRAMDACQAGDLAGALEQSLAAEALASEPRQPLALVAAWRLRGELLAQQGDLPAGEAFLCDALGLAERIDAPLEQALTLTTLAETLSRERRVADAAELGDRARTIALRLGATPILRRVDRLRGDLRLDSTDDRLSQLTPRELDVLQRLAQGMTSREIALALNLSVRTTERHVSNIYAKLGVNQRSEAIAYAISRGIS